MGDKFEEHMCPPKTLELVRPNGEKDIFTFQPLGFEFMPKFFKLMKLFYASVDTNKFKDGIKEEDLTDEELKNFMESMNDESLSLIKELIEGMLKESYPEEFKDDKGKKKISKFMAHNMMELMGIMMEMNAPTGGEIDNKDVTFGKK